MAIQNFNTVNRTPNRSSRFPVESDPVWDTFNNQMTNDRLRSEIQWQTGEPPVENSPGVLERLFDVLSRGSYASAEATRRLTDDQHETDNFWGSLRNMGDAAAGAWEGLTGRAKTSYSDVLEENFDVENPIVRGVAGFAGDVLLDPTTYLTGGVSKAGKLDDLADAGRVIGRGRQVSGPTAVGLNRADKAFQFLENTRVTPDELDEFFDLAKKKGIDPNTASNAELTSLWKNTRDKVVTERVDRAGQLFKESISTDEAESLLRPELEMKFMGRRLFGFQEPENINRWRRAKADSQEGMWSLLNRGFSTRYNLPDGMNEMLLRRSGQQVNWADQAGRSYRNYIKKFKYSNDQGRAIVHALDKGIAPGAEHLDEGFNATRRLLDELVQREKAAGIIPREAANEDFYLPQIFKKRTSDKAYSDAVRGTRPLGGEARLATANKDYKTLQEAIDEGNVVVEDLDTLIGQRLADHQQAMGNAHFLDDIRQNFGVRVGDIAFEDGTILRGDAPNTIAGFGEEYLGKKPQEVYENLLRENGFTERKFKLVNDATGEIREESYFIPERIDLSLRNLKRIQTDSRTANEFMQKFDKVHGMWKAGATIMNPGHHVRNLIGDAFLSWEGGGFDPRSFGQAMRTVAKRGDDQEWIKEVKGILGSAPSKTIRLSDDVAFEDQRLFRMFQEEGLGTGFFNTDVTAAHTGGGRLATRPLEGMRRLSGNREDVTRFSHFITKMKEYAKNYDGEVTDAVVNRWARDAGASVRKFLFDYSDLTPFEQDFVKRFSSFYTFMRKNLPLQLESIFLRPGKLAAVPKGIRAVQEALGTNDIDARIEHRIPDWMREEGNVLVGGMEGNSALETINSFGGLFDNAQGPQTISFDLPVQEAFDRWNSVLSPTTGSGSVSDRIQGGARELLGMSNPVFNALAEQATGGSTFTGGPIEENAGRYAMEMLPSGRILLESGLLGNEQDERFGEQLRNWFTGISSQTATPNRQRGESRRQEDVLRTLLGQLGI